MEPGQWCSEIACLCRRGVIISIVNAFKLTSYYFKIGSQK